MSARIGVCFIVNNFNVGGLEKLVIDLINNLDRERFNLSVVCIDGPGLLFDRVQLEKEACLVLDKSQAKRTPVGTFDPKSLWRMHSFFRERNVSVVHAHNVGPLVFGGLSARLGWHRPTVIYSEHNQIYSATRRGRQKFIFYVRLADHVVAVSHDLHRTLMRKVRPTAPVRVIHNGIDGSRFSETSGQAVRRELGLEKEDILIGTGVVLSRQKGIPYLLRAARQVIEQRPRVHFAIAGEGPMRKDLEKLAAQMGLGDRFRFLGYRSDMPQVIAAFDIYVLSSLWEGLPLALLEAMAMGKPIVATKAGGNPEVVEDGVNGFIVPRRDVAALRDALLRVSDDEGFRDRVKQVNRERFESEFSLSAMVEAHERLYIEVG